MNQCSNNTSSISSVLQCDDVLTEILLCLPPRSVFRFKCVSRKWRQSISDPNFRRSFKSRRKETSLPLLGFFQFTTHLRTILEQKSTQLSFLQTTPKRWLGFFIAGSSEGLILSGDHPWIYHVCNPITNQWLSLPKPNMECYDIAIGFSCKEESENGLIHFTVIRANVEFISFLQQRTLQIETFTSETGDWRESLLTSPSTFYLLPYSICDAVGGIIYWQALGGVVAAYDPNTKENCLRLLELPGSRRIAGVMGQSSDELLQYAMGENLEFEVWVLGKKLSVIVCPTLYHPVNGLRETW